MELGVHLPLMQFGEEPLSLERLQATVDTARDFGLVAVSANDHFVFQTPWLDGPTALATMIERSGEMELATTVSLAVLRGPVALAKALGAIDVLSGGRLVATLGPGSSEHDYAVAGIPFEERWKRFDEAIAMLRALLEGEPIPEHPRYYRLSPDVELLPRPWRQQGIPLWVEAGAPRWGLRASRGLATAGSPRRTTPRRSASPLRGWLWLLRSRTAGVTRTAFQTRSQRCGPGSRGIGRRLIACWPMSWRRF